MARPTKLTAEREKAVLDALTAGVSRKSAAEYAGIDETTLCRWLKRYADFASAVRAREAQCEIAMSARIRKAADDGDWHAAAWWLERRRREDWGRYERIDVRTIVDELAAEHGFTAEEARLAAEEAERWLKTYRRRHGGG